MPVTRGRPQVVALGWCFGEQAYLRSSWNVLDGLLVLISIIDILVSMVSDSGTKILGMLRVLRLLRTLRPLRCPGQVHPNGQHPTCPCLLPVTPQGALSPTPDIASHWVQLRPQQSPSTGTPLSDHPPM